MNERHMAYVCMGSNMGEPETNLARAREVLGALPGWKIEAASPVYFTEPQDMRDQPWFANQVLKVSCALDMTAPDFLDMLLDVEKRLGPRPGDVGPGDAVRPARYRSGSLVV